MNSQNLYSEACKLTPSGVSSPVRAFSPYPIFANSGSGCVIVDADGNKYIDMCMAYGPLILGHCNHSVISAVKKQMLNGTVFGMPSEPEIELLKKICEDVPCADMARLTNSGTEATMHAIRLARGFTGKKIIVKIDGCFHGSHNALMVNKTCDKKKAFSDGIPYEEISNTEIIRYNDIDAMTKLFETNTDIAAVIMEPIPGNMGVITPWKGYLDQVRKVTRENDVLLIFDEVITGYRVSKGGAQQLYGVTPDLCTLGKIIGGGYPAGALAGKTDIMEKLAPSGPVYEAGTFSGNPITAVAGLATIKELTQNRYKKLERKTKVIVKSIEDNIEDSKIVATVNSAPSMFQIFFGKRNVSDAYDAREADGRTFESMFRYMLGNGLYLPPSKMETMFLSTAHTYEAVDKFCESMSDFIGKIA
ncbi:MAG: glutamate-1-semialdehyde 2,1-aminomutase [archaeon]|nr:glutamate-1-semialdehyde 2,1-aminomutase [archaeon]